jgi:hypothetical protein
MMTVAAYAAGKTAIYQVLREHLEHAEAYDRADVIARLYAAVHDDTGIDRTDLAMTALIWVLPGERLRGLVGSRCGCQWYLAVRRLERAAEAVEMRYAS